MKTVDFEEAVLAYWDDGLDISEIAEKLSTTTTKVTNVLKKYIQL